MEAPDDEPVVLSGHVGPVHALAFSPDSRWLATGSTDNTAQLRRMRLNERLELAYSRTGRNFTWEAGQAYFPGETY